MPYRFVRFFQTFFQITLSFLAAICLIRVYEYGTIASKFFLPHTYLLELGGLLYDVWAWSIYCSVLVLPYGLLYLLQPKLANVVLHIVNCLVISIYIALLVTFSERNTPFDHEFFTRSGRESWLTVQQMMTSGAQVYIPFIVYILLYLATYHWLVKRWCFYAKTLLFLIGFCLVFTAGIVYSSPFESWFSQTSGYNLMCNKCTFWVKDSYQYFKNKQNTGRLTNKELEKAINFYQANQPFEFTSKEFPLMHQDNSKDVLGSFFNLPPNPPNIVVLVVEGLSRDFSGDDAFASSFTPFLDSLATKSLVWNNFLSTAPGTFAAHPAISGSLPYGKRGFSLMNIMPNHLSLIKILRANGYQTNFMIGFNPDFDNMGGYIRLQGTDFVLSKYGPKYKEMGVGSEGWTMGYPDDALFSRSFEVLDSIKKEPYLSIYHTGTTHMPYLFDQKPQYEKRFDQKLQTLHVAPNIKATLKKCKQVLVTFMFSDDCLRSFFAQYTKRPEYNNTLFFITGDHHIGSFPSTGAIDDYHVPLIIYSPLLKAPKKFYSVNSHNNLAPTIIALLQHNYKMSYHPQEVHWLGDVLDTCPAFRNIQSMPFMAWSREINDYVYKNYLLSYNQLYKLTPTLLQVRCNNDSIKQHITQLLNNFKTINTYVCDSNKIYNDKQNALPSDKNLLLLYTDVLPKKVFSQVTDTVLMPDFAIPKGYQYLYVEVSGEVDLPGFVPDTHPSLSLATMEKNGYNKHYLYWSNKDIVSLTTSDYVPKKWNTISTVDMFTLDDYKQIKNLFFQLEVWTDKPPINLAIKQLKVKIYGVKAKM